MRGQEEHLLKSCCKESEDNSTRKSHFVSEYNLENAKESSKSSYKMAMKLTEDNQESLRYSQESNNKNVQTLGSI